MQPAFGVSHLSVSPVIRTFAIRDEMSIIPLDKTLQLKETK